MIPIYLQGLSLGLVYVAPISMQNLFVINSAMSQKLRRAIATALIVVFWDVSLGLACFLGVGALLEALPWIQKILLGSKINDHVLTWLNRICGTVIICYGIKLLYNLVQMFLG